MKCEYCGKEITEEQAEQFEDCCSEKCANKKADCELLFSYE